MVLKCLLLNIGAGLYVDLAMRAILFFSNIFFKIDLKKRKMRGNSRSSEKGEENDEKVRRNKMKKNEPKNEEKNKGSF